MFLCAEDCTAYEATDRLPELIHSRLVVIRPYTADDRILYGHADAVEGAEAAGLIDRLLDLPETAYLHVRSARNGCFLFRVERA